MIWTGAIRHDKAGKPNYGAMQIGARGQGVDRPHRVAYRLAKGDITPGLLVMHSCNNKLCCNPDHLSLGTYSQNIRDAYRDGLRKKARFSQDDVSQMKTLRGKGMTLREVADKFQVSHSYILMLIKGKRAPHLSV